MPKDKRTDIERLPMLLQRFDELGIGNQIDYDKFYLYSIITHSTAIEGSTVTEVENQLLFDEGISPAGKPLVEQLMNLDLRDAYVHWLKWAKGEIHFTTEIICQMSASVMRRTGSVYHTMLGDFDSSLGELRKVNVRTGVNGRSYMAFQKVPSKLGEFCHWLNESLSKIDANDAVAVYRFSFVAHYRLVTIHPWVDGNGRTTRLLMNILQSHFGVPMSKVMKQDKAEYIQALIDAREVEDENIFTDKMIALLCIDLEKQIRDFEEDTNVTDTEANITEKSINVTENITETQRQILEILSREPEISQSRIAELVGIHRVNVNRNIQQLVRLSILRRIGSDRKGHWEINSTKIIENNK